MSRFRLASAGLLFALVAAACTGELGGGGEGGAAEGSGAGAGSAGAGGNGDPGPPPDPTEEVFDRTVLHHVDLEVDAAYFGQMDADPETRVPCAVTFDGVRLANSGCRKKGGYGSAQPLAGKTGFSLKFDQFEEGQKLHSLKRLTLNNAIQDPGFLNEHIGYELYRRMGIPAARTAHAVVRFNGVTKGLYVVAEAVDKQFLRRNFGEENDEGNLYEAPAQVDFVTNVNGMQLKNEVEDGRSREDLVDLAGLVLNVPDAQLEAALEEKLDLDGFITGYAIDATVNHWDGYSYWVINNYYMYHDPASDRFVFMPHGMDQLFQDVNFDVNAWPNGRLSQRVREIASLDAQFHQSITDVLTTAWDVEHFLARIDQATVVVNSADTTDPVLVSELASYNARVETARWAIAYRRGLLLGQPATTCGDGLVSVGEQCDDGNQVGGDGCSAGCFSEACEPGSYGGKSFVFCTDPAPISVARFACGALGGALATPESAGEAGWMSTTAFAAKSQKYWIGVSDEQGEGGFVKPDGTPVAYASWGGGKPDGAQAQNCVVMDPAQGGAWDDVACPLAYGFVCRVP
jgi:cysteine-rich repeat protein